MSLPLMHSIKPFFAPFKQVDRRGARMGCSLRQFPALTEDDEVRNRTQKRYNKPPTRSPPPPPRSARRLQTDRRSTLSGWQRSTLKPAVPVAAMRARAVAAASRSYTTACSWEGKTRQRAEKSRGPSGRESAPH